ncbi:MAG: hypothetical protein OIF48_19990 [Silicimonas sp.]|nr:hypothetical protein [Silicimonas sp.]
MFYRSRRRPTEYDALLVAESGEYPVKVRNVAEEGVFLTGVGGYVYPEAEVDLVVHDHRLPGFVSWVNEDKVGVKMKTPLSKSMVSRIARSTGGSVYGRSV